MNRIRDLAKLFVVRAELIFSNSQTANILLFKFFFSADASRIDVLEGLYQDLQTLCRLIYDLGLVD